jgi:hypothetical protein
MYTQGEKKGMLLTRAKCFSIAGKTCYIIGTGERATLSGLTFRRHLARTVAFCPKVILDDPIREAD